MTAEEIVIGCLKEIIGNQYIDEFYQVHAQWVLSNLPLAEDITISRKLEEN